MKFDLNVPLTWSDIISIILSLITIIISLIALIKSLYKKRIYHTATINLHDNSSPGVCINISIYNTSSEFLLIKKAFICKKFMRFFYNKNCLLQESILKVPFTMEPNSNKQFTIKMGLYFHSLFNIKKEKMQNLWAPYLCLVDSNGKKNYLKLAKNMDVLKKIDEHFYNSYYQNTKDVK